MLLTDDLEESDENWGKFESNAKEVGLNRYIVSLSLINS